MKENLLEEILEDELKKINYINNHIIEVGVMADDERNKREKDEDGLTNAELMFIHEYGSPTKNIPSRPVLGYTIKDMYDKEDSPYHEFVNKIVDGILDENWDYDRIDRELEILGSKVAKYARNMINEGKRLMPNSEKTIYKKSKKDKKGNIIKKSDIPLIDTGLLKRSITYRVVKIK